MSEWNHHHHHNKPIKLKSSIICLVGVLGCIIGVLAMDSIVEEFTFPRGPYIHGFDGYVFNLDIEIEYSDYLDWTYITRVNLRTETLQNGTFPLGVNTTRIWIIPMEGRFFPWRDYKLCLLKFDSSPTSPCSERCSTYIVEDFDGIQRIDFRIILEVNASGRVFYLDKWVNDPYYLEEY